VAFFRGTPMLVQAMVFYYGLNQLGVRIGFFEAGLTVVSLNTAAYLTEILKAGLLSLDGGQKEAALSLGMTHMQSYRYILLPQALKNMIPAIGNELIVNIKDTAVLSVIGVGELFYMGRAIASQTYRYTEAFILVSIVYLITVLIAVELLKRISLWLGKEPKALPSSSGGLL
jgi:putative lysine transport system permease protein